MSESASEIAVDIMATIQANADHDGRIRGRLSLEGMIVQALHDFAEAQSAALRARVEALAEAGTKIIAAHQAALQRLAAAEATLKRRYAMGATEQEIERKIADEWCAKARQAEAQRDATSSRLAAAEALLGRARRRMPPDGLAEEVDAFLARGGSHGS